MNTGCWMGNLTKDVELKEVGATHVAKFGIAINKQFKKKDGTLDKEVVFLDCEAWGKLGETISKYLKKGSKILIRGALKQDTWEDNDGKKRSKISVRVEEFNFVDSPEKSEGADDSPAKEPEEKPKTRRKSKDTQTEDDIPF